MPIGIYSAVRQYSIGDYVFTFLGFIGLAMPSFLLALIVMYFGLRWFGMSVGGLFSRRPATGAVDLGQAASTCCKHLPVPMLILSLPGIAQLVRIMRANLLDELRRPYVVTARARGLAERRVILKYPVRAALNPFASTIGYLLPYTVSGSIIISVVLSLPTVGPLLLRSLLSQDMLLALHHHPAARAADGDRHAAVRPAADVDRSAHPRSASCDERQPSSTEPLDHRGGNPRRGCHAAPAHLVALQEAQAGGGQRGDRAGLFYLVAVFADVIAYSRRRSTPRRRAATSRRSRSTGSTPTAVSTRMSTR